MLKVKEIVKELKVFERNKVPLEIKVLVYNIHSNILSKKDCQNFRTLSSFENISMELGKKSLKKNYRFHWRKRKEI